MGVPLTKPFHGNCRPHQALSLPDVACVCLSTDEHPSSVRMRNIIHGAEDGWHARARVVLMARR